MFKNLTDLTYKRSKLEAFGFYLAYFILSALLSGIVAGIAGRFINIDTQGMSPAEQFSAGLKLGRMVGGTVIIIFCSVLSFMILKKKNLFSKFGSILLALTSVLLSMIGGSLLGMIPVAILSTRDKIEN